MKWSNETSGTHQKRSKVTSIGVIMGKKPPFITGENVDRFNILRKQNGHIRKVKNELPRIS